MTKKNKARPEGDAETATGKPKAQRTRRGGGKRTKMQGKAASGAPAALGKARKPKSAAIDNTRQPTKTGNPNWEKGCPSPNPAGRPKGSRNKFSENYIDAMHRAFEERGEAAIHAVIDESPAEFLRLCSAIIPKSFGLEEGSENAFLTILRAISDGTINQGA